MKSFDTADQRTALCPQCRREISVRPLDIYAHLDRQWERQRAQGRSADQESVNRLLSAGNCLLPPIIAIAEDVRSLWNVGSIFRTADGAGLVGLILCGITGTPPRKEIAKTSLGAEDSVSWLYARSAAELIPLLKSAGCFVIGLECLRAHPQLPDSLPLADALRARRLRFPLALFVGNEVCGLSPEALHALDLICDLPMRGMKESLNVAVAFGIGAYLIAEAASAGSEAHVE